jgi:hypothetical protein
MVMVMAMVMVIINFTHFKPIDIWVIWLVSSVNE